VAGRCKSLHIMSNNDLPRARACAPNRASGAVFRQCGRVTKDKTGAVSGASVETLLTLSYLRYLSGGRFRA